MITLQAMMSRLCQSVGVLTGGGGGASSAALSLITGRDG